MYVEAKMRKIFHEILILFQFKKAGQAETKNDNFVFEILEIFENREKFSKMLIF